jgi:hypothetical protein
MTYFSDQWRANPEHDLSPQAQRHSFGEHHNDKHIKAFVGIVLLMVMGFVLAGLHLNPPSDSQNPEQTVQTSHAFIRPAN